MMLLEKTQTPTAVILPEWYKAYKTANTLYPQTAVALPSLSGREVLESLQSGEVNLAYVASSQFTDEQMEDLKDIIAKAHRLYGIKQMPSGYAVEGEVEFPDSYLTDTWTLVANTIIKAATNFVIWGEQDRYQGPLLSYLKSVNRELFLPAGFEVLEDLDRVSGSYSYSRRIGSVGDLFKTSYEAFLSKGALVVAGARLRSYIKHEHLSKKEVFYPKDLERVCTLAEIAKNAIARKALEDNIPAQTAQQFYSDVTGFEL